MKFRQVKGIQIFTYERKCAIELTADGSDCTEPIFVGHDLKKQTNKTKKTKLKNRLDLNSKPLSAMR